ncbi:hypothetical protein NE237_030896 [Protea cynaroides]|uniref:Uncharacterized protein n=1 Tax=Protea cynaroides TaxID=273540 RepID=A0A9Q0JVA9_9MAGN|nr:hypothetical protein NE237_030896 [Protea cynaroides]
MVLLFSPSKHSTMLRVVVTGNREVCMFARNEKKDSVFWKGRRISDSHMTGSEGVTGQSLGDWHRGGAGSIGGIVCKSILSLIFDLGLLIFIIKSPALFLVIVYSFEPQ